MRTFDEPLVKYAVAYYYYCCKHSFDKKVIEEYFSSQDNSFYSFLKSYFPLYETSISIEEGVGKELSKDELQRIIKQIDEEGVESVLFSENELKSNPQVKLIKQFYRILPKFIMSRKFCCSISFSEKRLNNIRNYYKIGIDESILYCSNAPSTTYSCTLPIAILPIAALEIMRAIKNNILIITDYGLHVHYSNGRNLFIGWCDFNGVEYKSGTYNFKKNEKKVYQLDKDILFDNQDSNECARFAEDLTNIAILFVPELSPVELAERGLYEDALNKADNIIRSGKDVPMGHLSKAQVMRMMELDKTKKDASYEGSFEFNDNLQNVLKEYRKAILQEEKTENKKDFIAHVLICMADTEKTMGRYASSRKHFIEGLGDCDDMDKYDVMESLVEVECLLQKDWDNYTAQYKYKDRKFIMPIRDSEIGGCIADGITTFRMSNIPSCIKFPMGHPVANQLYIGHPFSPSLYVPYEDSDEVFFLDKVRELRFLLECLGAEEILITSTKGKDVSELRDETSRISGGVGIKGFSAEAEYNNQNKRQNDSSSHKQRTVTVKLDPMQRPFLPDGLIWYNEMPQWQRLVQSRLRGNLLEYSEFVSTAETKFTSSSEMTDIKASAKLLWAKAHAEVNECLEKQFKESTETQWKVDVKFRSVKDFGDEVIETTEIEEAMPLNQMGLSEKELAYAKEVKFCLEDGSLIDDAERRLLERKRAKLGISQERAAEIENSLVQPQLTEDEQEYLEAVKDEVVDGQIPESSRRLLDRLRNRMGITEERAREIELFATK